jgi:hypothetical protein
MTTQLTLPQNGLKVGNQIVAEGDNVSLGTNVGVKGDLKVGGSIFTNRITTSYVTKVHGTNETLVIDCNYPQHNITLSSNFPTITFTNVPDKSLGATTVTVYLQQDILGNRVIGAWPSYLTWPNSGPLGNTLGLLTAYGTLDSRYPVLQNLPFKLDVFQFTTFDGGLTWYGTQINPPQVQNSDLAPLQYALNNNPANNQSGTIVQTKQALTTAFTDFSTVNYTDLITMTFYPKYKTSKLMLTAILHYGTAVTTDYSAHFMFTVGTNPITGTNILSTNALATNTTTDLSQNVHFGGYFNGVDAGTNNVYHPSGSISYSHGFEAGTAIDLRIRGRHADAWSDRSLILNRSWGFPSGSYSAANTSSFTVMEFLP